MDSRALAGELPPVVGENGDVGRLAVMVHSDVDHDRASFLSFVLSDAAASSSEHGSGGPLLHGIRGLVSGRLAR
jgi:hypothetical protein